MAGPSVPAAGLGDGSCCPRGALLVACPRRWTAWRTCGEVHGVHGSANRGGGRFPRLRAAVGGPACGRARLAEPAARARWPAEGRCSAQTPTPTPAAAPADLRLGFVWR